MFHMSVKKFGQIGIGMAYLHIFLITIHEIDTGTEVYFEPFLIPFWFKIRLALTYSVWYYEKDETRALHGS